MGYVKLKMKYYFLINISIFRVAVGLERGPFSLVRIIQKLLELKSSDSGLENRD
jgi:hypothetical protein